MNQLVLPTLPTASEGQAGIASLRSQGNCELETGNWELELELSLPLPPLRNDQINRFDITLNKIYFAPHF